MADVLLLVLIPVCAVYFAINVLISAAQAVFSGSLFKNNVSYVSDTHPVYVTPAGSTFMIWNVIFLWIFISFVYLIVNIFRRNEEIRGKVYNSPAIWTRAVSVVFLLNMVFYTSWLFAWDNVKITVAAVLLAGLAITNLLTISLVAKNIFENISQLHSVSSCEIWVYRVLTLNGFGIYFAWTLVATIVNSTIAIVYDGGASNRVTSLAALGVLTALIVIWTIVELAALDNWFRYLVTPLLTFIWASYGIYRKLDNELTGKDMEAVKTFTLVLLILCAVIFVLRSILMVVRHIKSPLEWTQV